MKYLLVILTLILISCKGENGRRQNTYYSDGRVMEEYVYKNKNNLKEYSVKLYDEEGILLQEVDFSEGRKDGLQKFFYKNGNIESSIVYDSGRMTGTAYYYSKSGITEMTKSFYEDALHGFTREYKNEVINQEFLYLEGRQILYNKYFQNVDGQIVKVLSSVVDTSGKAIIQGQMVYNSLNSKPIPEKCFYYEILLEKDTIDLGETVDVRICFINNNDWKVKFKLGTLNKDLNFISDPRVIKSMSNCIDFMLKPDKGGNYLIQGKLSIEMIEAKDVEFNDIIVFKDLYVNPS